ncbi:hypothetical protein [Lysinibacillus boronitolerans]|uniref:Uncharacterized protein n=1 Tax=Lysinibacillus boronitolerans JCM 21713 = 10a = NBRC 103108 TaxID=1294264 RepID=A0ABR4Y489_9BACI|nr:hypothetical protein [Lysinibacillus boronitolerans]KGR88868.1 hypothetical protein CD31_02530 [Lysinibacillus boronitolerans JCM 21713 = 10a = NBRC 103108]
MANIKVKVKNGAFPIRYKGERYLVGEELTIDEKHFNESMMERLEEQKKAAQSSKTSESE